jgi:VanZ family protein
VIRWLVLGLWYAAILFTSSLTVPPEVGQPWLGFAKAKGGHIFVYAVLGWLLMETLRSRRAGFGLAARLALPVTIIASAILASLDETRQTFVYGRTGQVADVLLDTLSLSGGALLHQWLLRGLGGQPVPPASHLSDEQPGDERPVEGQHQQMHRQDLSVAVDVRQERHHDREVQPDEQVQWQGAQGTSTR